MERQSRLIYSEEQKEVLTTFFNEGMTSTEKAMCDKIRACAARVGISENQVKVFLSLHLEGFLGLEVINIHFIMGTRIINLLH